jgi:hypothetical protein
MAGIVERLIGSCVLSSIGSNVAEGPNAWVQRSSAEAKRVSIQASVRARSSAGNASHDITTLDVDTRKATERS